MPKMNPGDTRKLLPIKAGEIYGGADVTPLMSKLACEKVTIKSIYDGVFYTLELHKILNAVGLYNCTDEMFNWDDD